MKASFALPDAMAVGLSKLVAKSDGCMGFVAMKPEDNPKVFYAGLADGNLRWYESEDEEVDKDEFLERSWVIPWGALPLSQQVMMAFAVRAWMEGQAQAFHLKSSLHA
jgi:hypothetical protein